MKKRNLESKRGHHSLERIRRSPEFERVNSNEIGTRMKAVREMCEKFKLSPKETDLVAELCARFFHYKFMYLEELRQTPHLSWAELQARLIAFRNQLETLIWMDETDGRPAVFAIRDENFYLADMNPHTPTGRRWLNYHQADELATQKGADLMYPNEYYYIVDRQRFLMDADGGYTWLNSRDQEELTGGYAWVASCSPGFASVSPTLKGRTAKAGSFRCSLVVGPGSPSLGD